MPAGILSDPGALLAGGWPFGAPPGCRGMTRPKALLGGSQTGPRLCGPFLSASSLKPRKSVAPERLAAHRHAGSSRHRDIRSGIGHRIGRLPLATEHGALRVIRGTKRNSTVRNGVHSYATICGQGMSQRATRTK